MIDIQTSKIENRDAAWQKSYDKRMESIDAELQKTAMDFATKVYENVQKEQQAKQAEEAKNSTSAPLWCVPC